MSSRLYINKFDSKNTSIEQQFPSNHSKLCESIEYTQLLQCLFNEVVNAKNSQLFSSLFFDILIPQLTLPKISQLIQSEIFNSLYHTDNNRSSFIQQIIDFKQENETVLANTQTTQQTNTFSLLNIPNCILSHSMSFLSALDIIKIESTCYKFFESANQLNTVYAMESGFFYSIRKINSSMNYFPLQYFRQKFANICRLHFNTSTFQFINDNITFMKIFKNLLHLEIFAKYSICLTQIIKLKNIYSSIQYLSVC
eukprot:433244_1